MEVLVSIQSKADGNVREIKREVADGLAIGRGAEEGILLDGPDLSREHLVVNTDGSAIYVTDLSNNGTWLNGTRLRRSIKSKVRSDDTIEVPGYILSIRLPEDLQQPVGALAKAAPLDFSARSAAPAEPPKASGLMAMLEPVFHFIGSFTFAEKFFTIMAFGGLVLLYAYFGS